MLAKITAKNQLTLPKSLIQAVGATEYFDVEVRGGQLVLTPVRIQRGDAVRAKLAELNITVSNLSEAVTWSRAPDVAAGMVNEPGAVYDVKQIKSKKAAASIAVKKTTALKKPKA